MEVSTLGDVLAEARAYKKEGDECAVWAGKPWPIEELIIKLQELIVSFGEEQAAQPLSKAYTEIACHLPSA